MIKLLTPLVVLGCFSPACSGKNDAPIVDAPKTSCRDFPPCCISAAPLPDAAASSGHFPQAFQDAMAKWTSTEEACVTSSRCAVGIDSRARHTSHMRRAVTSPHVSCPTSHSLYLKTAKNEAANQVRDNKGVSKHNDPRVKSTMPRFLAAQQWVLFRPFVTYCGMQTHANRELRIPAFVCSTRMKSHPADSFRRVSSSTLAHQ